MLLSFVDWADLVTLSKKLQVGSSLLICYLTIIAFAPPSQAFVYVHVLIEYLNIWEMYLLEHCDAEGTFILRGYFKLSTIIVKK